MPPKPKFTREQITSVALDIVKQEGVESLTARNLGDKLGTSPRPIFTVFKNMEEVKYAARELALKEFEKFLCDYEEYTPSFKRIGMLMISYAIREPEMYKLLFMQEYAKRQSLDDFMKDLGGLSDICIGLICRDYNLTQEKAKTLFEQIWVYTFGIGTLCAMKVCDFTEEEIAERLGQIFVGMLMFINFDDSEKYIVQPKRRSEKDSGSFCVSDVPYANNYLKN